jgi:hypothetical protein
MGVELDPLIADRNREIKFSALLEHPEHILPTDEMAVVVYWIAVTAETEVLQRMETGEGITVIDEREIFGSEIRTGKTDAWDTQMEIADIQDLDLPKGGHMGHKTVDAGADVHVLDGVVLKDLAGDVQILIEVVFRENSAFLVPLLETGAKLPEWKAIPTSAGLTPDFSIFLQKERQSLEVGEKGHSLDNDPELHGDPFVTLRGFG